MPKFLLHGCGKDDGDWLASAIATDQQGGASLWKPNPALDREVGPDRDDIISISKCLGELESRNQVDMVLLNFGQAVDVDAHKVGLSLHDDRATGDHGSGQG